jgi:uncharacterized protein (UPF0128 family)
METTAPDIFTNVHKGIRNALFAACTALGRAGDDDARSAAARAVLRDALRFVAHHGENEDLLLVPLLRERAPAVFERIEQAHGRVNEVLVALVASADVAPPQELYERTCGFLALYLEHMREEEHDLEPAIRAALSVEALAGFGRQSVERTAPADQRMMLGWMLPAMTRADVEAFLARLPAEVAEQLRPLASTPAAL